MDLKSDEPVRVLFVSCRGNLRSVLAGSCLRHLAPGKFKVAICGEPGRTAREPSSIALEALAKARIAPIEGRAPDWSGFVQHKLRAPDIAIVLDEGAALRMPALPQQPEFAVWHFPDLLQDANSPPALRDVLAMLHALRRRSDIVANLPIRRVDRDLLRSDLRDLAFWR